MPEFPPDLERPYGSLCGEGYSKTQPPHSDLLTVIPALRKMFVATPLETAELIEAYLSIEPDAPRRCNLPLYNQIDGGLGVCASYCSAFLRQSMQPGFLMFWFAEECDLISQAIGEHTIAVEELETAVGQIYPTGELKTTEDRVRPIFSALSRETFVAYARTIRGTEVMLNMYERVLKNTEDDPAALGVVWRNIMSLKSDWEPVFGTYKKVAAAVRGNQAIPQRRKGHRFEVDVAAFLSWIDIVKNLSPGAGINPLDEATWTDEFWDMVSKKFAMHLREKRTVREERRRQNG